MPTYKGHNNLTGFTGTRVGENIGLVESHYTYEKLQDMTPEMLDINKITKNRKTNQNPDTITRFTNILPPKVYKTARVDGVGTWNHSVIKANGAEISFQGKRYINELIPQDTFPKMTTIDKVDYYTSAMKAANEDELTTLINLISTTITNKKVASVTTTGQNFKQDILDVIAEVERTSKIPRRYLTLTLSNRALDALVKYEMGSIDYVMGNADGKKNYWSVGDIVNAEIGQLPADVLYSVHCPYITFSVGYSPVSAPGFYAISQVDNSPSLMRFVLEDGYAMEYGDASVGVIVTDDTKEVDKPYIEFTLPQIIVPLNATVDAAYLKDKDNLQVFVDTFNEKRKDVTATATFTIEDIDTTKEGLHGMTIDATVDGIAATQKMIMVRVSNSLTPTDVQASDDIASLKAEIEALKAAKTKTQADEVSVDEVTVEVKEDTKKKDDKKEKEAK